LPAPSYTHPNLTTGDEIKAAHIQELRGKANETITAGGAGGIDIEWLVSDQLGTPRMILTRPARWLTPSVMTIFRLAKSCLQPVA
jgi:hypothetical protein